MARDIKLFRQFCTNPVARDTRVILPWKRSPVKNVAWQATLNGNEDVRLYWYRDSWCKNLVCAQPFARREPRAPTGLDVNMLLAILHIAISKNTDTVYFPSITSLVKAPRCFHSNTHYYRWIALDAIRLWQLLRISWPRLDLPPPIESVEVSGYSRRWNLTIKIHEAWMTQLRNHGSVNVRLPLPTVSTPLNIVLFTLACHDSKRKNINLNEFAAKMAGRKDAKKSHPVVLLTSWLVVQEWYEERGGKIKWKRAPYIYGIKRTGSYGLIASRTFDITLRRRPL